LAHHNNSLDDLDISLRNRLSHQDKYRVRPVKAAVNDSRIVSPSTPPGTKTGNVPFDPTTIEKCPLHISDTKKQSVVRFTYEKEPFRYNHRHHKTITLTPPADATVAADITAGQPSTDRLKNLIQM
nr:hypothetical protein [Tanacetum cinerariifolium]